MRKRASSARSTTVRWLLLAAALCLAIAACGNGDPAVEPAPIDTDEPEEPQEDEPEEEEPEEPAEDEEAISLRMAHDLPQDSAYHAGALAFAEEAEQLSGGRLLIDVFPDAQLGDARAMLDGMQTGSIDVAPLGSGFMSGVIPAIQFIDLPFLWDGPDHVHGVLDDDPVNEILAPLFDEQGLVPLAWWELGWRQITNNVRPITSPDDLAGIRLRVPESPLYLASWELAGADVTPLDFAELYSALEQGVVDGQENPLNLIHSVRFFEVQDYLTLSDHAYSAAMLVVSQQTWEELDDELQSALQEAALRSGTVQREAASGADDEFLQDMIDFGVDVSELDEAARQDFRERMSGAWDIYLDAVGDTGQSILDVVEDARQ